MKLDRIKRANNKTPMARIAAGARRIIFQNRTRFCIFEKLVKRRLLRLVVVNHNVLRALRVARVNFRCYKFRFDVKRPFARLQS